MAARLVPYGVSREQSPKPNGFQAKLLSHEGLAAGSLVTFVEQQVKRLQHAIETASQLFASRNLEWDGQFAYPLLGPNQSLGDSGFSCQKCLRNFRGTETAKGLQRESRLGFLRDQRMAAGEHQPETAVFQFVVEGGRICSVGVVHPLLDERDDLRFFFPKGLLPADGIQGKILGGLGEPGGWIFRNSVIRPRLQGAGQGLLDYILG